MGDAATGSVPSVPGAADRSAPTQSDRGGPEEAGLRVLFASNVALTYRKGDEGTKLLGADRQAFNGEASPSPSNPNTQPATMSGLAALAARGPTTRIGALQPNFLLKCQHKRRTNPQPQPIRRASSGRGRQARREPLRLPTFTRRQPGRSTRLPVLLTFSSRARRSTRC